MSIWNFVVVGAGLTLLVLGIIGHRKRGKLSVTFKSYDEVNSLADVANWARREIAADDPRRKALVLLSVYLPGNVLQPPAFVRISAQDLQLLAPFIDRFIDGKGPPLNLPADYEDWRPAALTAFKARMQREGLWPPQAGQ